MTTNSSNIASSSVVQYSNSQAEVAVATAKLAAKMDELYNQLTDTSQAVRKQVVKASYNAAMHEMISNTMQGVSSGFQGAGSLGMSGSAFKNRYDLRKLGKEEDSYLNGDQNSENLEEQGINGKIKHCDEKLKKPDGSIWEEGREGSPEETIDHEEVRRQKEDLIRQRTDKRKEFDDRRTAIQSQFRVNEQFANGLSQLAIFSPRVTQGSEDAMKTRDNVSQSVANDSQQNVDKMRNNLYDSVNSELMTAGDMYKISVAASAA